MEMDAKTSNDVLDGDAVVEVASDKVVGAIEVAVKGNYCSDDNPFAHDLMANEKILKTQHVVLGSPSLSWEQKLLVLMTCGLYYLYLRYCGCCRPKQLFAGRAIMGVTNAGRLLLWDSEIHGEQTSNICFCIPGFKRLHSHTLISTFSLRKLTYVERSFSRDRRCCGICPARLDSSLRLFFNDYPDQSHVDAMQFANLPRAVTMSKLQAIPNAYWWSFAFYRFAGYMGNNALVNSFTGCGKILFGCIEQFRHQLEFIAFGWGSVHVLEIMSPTNDTMKKGGDKPPGTDWKALLEMERAIIELRNPPTAITAEADVDPTKFQFINGEEAVHIVEGHPGRVNVRDRDLVLLQDEQIIDVFPNSITWTCVDILLTIATVSIYYWIVLKKRFATRGALIITNKRLFEIFAFTKSTGHYSPTEEGNINDFDLIVRFWLFGKLSQGFIEWNNDMVYGHIKTKYGGLQIFPTIADPNCCIPICYGMREEWRKRMKSFLLKFSQNAEAPLMGEHDFKAEVPGNSFLLNEWRPVANEKPLRLVESEFNWDCQNTCFKYMHCGVQPFVPEQQLLVSTHRVWAAARAKNSPWCLVDCLSARNDVIYWKPLRDVKGWRIVGDTVVAEDCLTRICSCFECCTPVSAVVALELATTKGFPISVRRHGTHPKYGKIADPAIAALRELFAQVIVRSNVAHNAIPNVSNLTAL